MAFAQENLNEVKEELNSLKVRFTEEISNRIQNLQSFEEAIEIYTTLNKISEPIDEDFRSILLKSFKSCYEDVNQGIITYPHLKIKWSVLEQMFGFPNPQFGSNEGIGFFYLLNDANQLTYMIAKAKRETIGTQPTITPIDAEGPYIMVDPTNDTGTLISKNSYINFNSNYRTKLKFESLTGPPTYNVANFNHPVVTFHDGSKLVTFFNNNFPTGAPADLCIVIEHGTSLGTIIQDIVGGQIKSCLHTAMVFFETNGNLVLNNNHIIATPFKNKGLDVGRLCPPDC